MWTHGLLLVVATGTPAAALAHGATERVSLAADGSQLVNGGGRPYLSGRGRFVAFNSFTVELLPDGVIAASNIFVRDRRTGHVERASVAPGGAPADSTSATCGLSKDGRFLAFTSTATNLVPGDTNGQQDVLVRDRLTSTNELVSIGVGGVPATGGPSETCALSANGRFVAFQSHATNLVAGGTSGYGDLFVRDRRLRTTVRIGGGPDGRQPTGRILGLSISADGRFVAFQSVEDGLVPGDDNHKDDAFVHDGRTGKLELASVARKGGPGDAESLLPSISDDGRYVAFSSFASNLVPGDTNGLADVFVRDRRRGSTRRVSVRGDGTQADSNSFGIVRISANGRYVAFNSFATNLTPHDTNGRWDVFVHDRRSGKTRLASVSTDGAQGNANSEGISLTADGRTVAFHSSADNLVPNDTNGNIDAFVRTLQP